MMETVSSKSSGPWIPPPGKKAKILPPLDDYKPDPELDQEINDIILDHIQRCTQEIVNDCFKPGSNVLRTSPAANYCLNLKGENVVSGQEKAFLNRSLTLLRRDQGTRQSRSPAGQDQNQAIKCVEDEICQVKQQLTNIDCTMKDLSDTNVECGSDAAQKRESLIKKLNELECTHQSLKQALGVNGSCPMPNGEDLASKLENAECRNREYECKIRDQEVAIDRLKRQIQCEKDYVASLSRMQTEMEEARSCLQRELLCKAQELERSTIQMKNLQSQMCGHIQEVERLQEYVDQTTKKCECEKDAMKKALKCQQERLCRAEDCLQKAMVRIECMESENCKLRGDVKQMECELDTLRPEAEAKKQLEEVCQKLQAHLKELQPLPELLKTTELRLQEEQFKYQQSEQRVSEQARLICELTGKLDSQVSTLKCMKDKVDLMAGENAQLQCKIDNVNISLRQAQDTVNELNSALHLKNELINQLNMKLDDKDANTLAINRQLEEALNESQRLSCLVEERTQHLETQNRARVKEMQDQLGSCKQELKQLKAEKQDMECKYGRQMTDLKEKLEQCDTATHNMQSYIAYLKTSYASVFNDPNLAAMCNPSMVGTRESGIC